MAKVFGIGFHKTGTTTLAVALDTLGYRVCRGAGPIRRTLGAANTLDLLHRNELNPILQIAEAFDAFTDNPWFILYQALDRRFEGSKFILTHRTPSQWLTSALRYYGQSESPLRQWIYGVGTPAGHETLWIERYQRHIDEVQQYFADRPEDLLVVDWDHDAGWPTLCAFLGRPVPPQPFPHVRPVRSTQS